MPRVDVPVKKITKAGVGKATEVNGDPVNNHSVINDGRTVLFIRNAGATVARTATLKVKQVVDGLAVASRTYLVPLSDQVEAGPFDPLVYGSTLEVDVDNAELKLSAYSW